MAGIQDASLGHILNLEFWGKCVVWGESSWRAYHGDIMPLGSQSDPGTLHCLWPCRSPWNHLGNGIFSSLRPCARAPVRQIWFDSSFFPALVRFSFIYDHACAAQFHCDFSSEIVRWKRPFAISTASFSMCLCITITPGATSKTLSSSASQSWALKYRIFCTGYDGLKLSPCVWASKGGRSGSPQFAEGGMTCTTIPGGI